MHGGFNRLTNRFSLVPEKSPWDYPRVQEIFERLRQMILETKCPFNTSMRSAVRDFADLRDHGYRFCDPKRTEARMLREADIGIKTQYSEQCPTPDSLKSELDACLLFTNTRAEDWQARMLKQEHRDFGNHFDPEKFPYDKIIEFRRDILDVVWLA